MIGLQFSAKSGLPSLAIRTFTRGWVTHVDSMLPDGRLFGARWNGGVQARLPDYTKFTQKKVMYLPATPEQETVYFDFMLAQLGKPYDHTAIAAFVFNRDWREDDSWFCSELVTVAMETAKIIRPLTTSSNRVTPEMSMFLCSAICVEPKDLVDAEI